MNNNEKDDIINNNNEKDDIINNKKDGANIAAVLSDAGKIIQSLFILKLIENIFTFYNIITNS